MNARNALGFSLIELMVAVAIVGILAGIALPSYQEYVRAGNVPQATSGLANGRVQFEQFFQDNRTYVGAVCPGAAKSFNFACSNQTDATFTITATGTGTMTGFTYTINQANTMTSATPWGNGASCWISKKGQSC